MKIEYITKIFVNYEKLHSRFIKGNKAWIDSMSTLNNTSVSECLIKFFPQYYSPAQVALSLVIVNNQKHLSCALTMCLALCYDFTTFERSSRLS